MLLSPVPRPQPHELLSTNIRRVAQLKGLSYVFLASQAGITTERLLAIFAGDFDPDLKLLNKLAETLGVELADLFADDPEHN